MLKCEPTKNAYKHYGFKSVNFGSKNAMLRNVKIAGRCLTYKDLMRRFVL